MIRINNCADAWWPYPIEDIDYSDNGRDDEDDVGDVQDGGNDDIIRHKIDQI